MEERETGEKAREDEALRRLADEGMALPAEEIPAGARYGANLAPDPHLEDPQPDA